MKARAVSQHVLLAFVALATLVAFMACSTTAAIYPGPRRPADEVATLKGGEGVLILSVNNRELGGKSYELLPSEYTVVFRGTIHGRELSQHVDGRASVLCRIYLDVRAGHAYTIMKERPEKVRTTKTMHRSRVEHRFGFYLLDGSEPEPLDLVDGVCEAM